ncbi:hypothetical protein I316_02034 [Kwoniella heveanensis BCC8398]|uniref:Uncharacterized protein n=1 Tax=Kwoniella heveanensis BCC8398 TaxID=1296120 RepID=A0A1B9GYS4_9TREE|nr:hypothetical protein I316_02034 [Kwoniella heveanensis BCC8398]
MTAKEAYELLDLCDKFECRLEFKKRLTEKLGTVDPGYPWNLLIYASRKDDRALGLIALRAMDRQIFAKGIVNPLGIVDSFWSLFCRLSGEWRIKMMRCAFEDTCSATVKRLNPYEWRSNRGHKYTDYREDLSEELVVPFRRDWDSVCAEFAKDDW